jgi:hypothetical protein
MRKEEAMEELLTKRAVLQHAVTLNRAFLNELEVKSASSVLTPAEVQDLLVTEKLVLNQEQLLKSLESEIASAQIDINMAQVQAQWMPLVEQKEAAYGALLQAIATVAQATVRLEQVHHQQDLLLRKLPRPVYERLSLPEGGTNYLFRNTMSV